MFIFLFILLVTGVNTSSPNLPRAGGSKAGLGWGGGGEISQFEAGKVSWYYTWSPTSWVQPPPNLEFVPMLWGGKDASTFAKAVTPDSIAANGWTHILGMNEPQEESQSNMSPGDAANMWKTYLEPLRAKNPNLRLGSPAPSSRPNGIQWIHDFIGNCNVNGGCTVDFIALHYYGVNSTQFIQHINDYHNAFQRPIWVTEWACQDFNNGPQCSYNQIVEFLDETQTYMDNTDWIERYAWFGAMAKTPINKDTGLMDSSGEITDLGKQYMGSQAPMTHGGVMRLEFPFGMLPASALASCLYAIYLIPCLYSDLAAGRKLPYTRRQNVSAPLKAGLGWGGGGNITQFEGHEVSWYFTWSPQSWVVPPPKQLEFVPQLWGNRDAELFSSVVNTTSIAANGWKNILGMNEPQIPDQANMSAQDGVQLWKARLEPLKSSGVRLGSPATASGPSGKLWMQEFFSLCAGTCTVDFVALHWYGNVASEFIDYLEDFHDTFQRPVWVTEYSCQNFVNGAQCSYEEIVDFLNATQTYMDQTPWVERYAWFGAMASLPNNVNNLTALMDPSGVINDLGRQYIGSPVIDPSPTTVSSAVPTSTVITMSSLTTSNTSTTSFSTRTVFPSSDSSSSTSLTATSATTTSPYVIINNAKSEHLGKCLVVGLSVLWLALALAY
ncbi:Glycosyl hydrolase catalytic core, partial [Rhizoctonia solani]